MQNVVTSGGASLAMSGVAVISKETIHLPLGCLQGAIPCTPCTAHLRYMVPNPVISAQETVHTGSYHMVLDYGRPRIL